VKRPNAFVAATTAWISLAVPVAPWAQPTLTAPGAVRNSTTAAPVPPQSPYGATVSEPTVTAPASVSTSSAGPPAPSSNVRSTIVTGTGVVPVAPHRAPPTDGDITLNYPGVEVRPLARAVLGDLLRLNYAVAPEANATVILTPSRPVSRAEVIGLFEEALRQVGLALVDRSGTWTVVPIGEARQQVFSTPPDQPGYATETITLKFISPSQLRTLINGVAPGAVSGADDSRSIIVIAGTSVQRRAVAQLVKEFDVDWLRGASFALFVPQHTDSRLIEPELEKLINGPNSPSAGLVRLIGMEQLNGILAVANQPQLLEDVRRWVEVLDREGQSTERHIYVYQVQNGRSVDLAKTLLSAFGGGAGGDRTASQATGAAQGAPPRPGVVGLDQPVSTQSMASQRPASGGEPSRSSGRDAGDQGTTSGMLQISATPGATITSDDGNNALVLFVTAREYAVVAEALAKLDVVPLQVVIEAAVTEVQLNAGLKYGVQFSGKGGTGQFALSQDASGLPVSLFPGFSYVNATNNITATLNALSNLTRVDVLSAPKLMVLNNHTASLQVGDQVPIATGSAVSTIGSNAPIVNSIDYRDTGVILKITPRVNASGLVLLDITQEVSDVSATDSSTLQSPTIQERKLTTSIAVQDGQTVALGGLIRNNTSHGRTGIPVLSAIPGVGFLFGNRNDSTMKTELIVLLTPRVVRNQAQAEAAAEALRKEIAPINTPTPVTAFRP
jgi:general secretion pathway protein D